MNINFCFDVTYCIINLIAFLMLFVSFVALIISTMYTELKYEISFC